MVYMERKRLREIEDGEAAGTSFWTEDIPRAARVKIAAQWEAAKSGLGYRQDEVLEDGIVKVMKARAGIENPIHHPSSWLNTEDADLSLSYLEAVMFAFERFLHDSQAADSLQSWINVVFNDHRVAFRVVERQVIPLNSDELHVAVVEPALRLLIDSRFSAAHDSYLKALKEISNNDAGDAITDAATALQETLTALGCDGDVLSVLIKDAKTKGLFKQHDQQLHEAATLMMKWAASERNKNSDAHKHSDATLDDAWLMVHVVGALIVRLTGVPRGATEKS